MSTTTWAHLPNAAHIDWVLHTLRSHPQVWYAAWDNTRDAARAAAWDAARAAAHAVTRTAARDAAWGAARAAAWGDVWDAARAAARAAAHAVTRDAARDAAWGDVWAATHALIAWDDAGRWLRTHWSAAHMAADAGDHAAVLLLPAAHVAWELGYSQQMKELV